MHESPGVRQKQVGCELAARVDALFLVNRHYTGIVSTRYCQPPSRGQGVGPVPRVEYARSSETQSFRGNSNAF